MLIRYLKKSDSFNPKLLILVESAPQKIIYSIHAPHKLLSCVEATERTYKSERASFVLNA